MVDYTTLPYEEDGVVLKKARAKSKGGMLTDNVQAGSVLPNARAAMRPLDSAQMAADLYRQGNDMYQSYLDKEESGGDGAMLNAMAAQFAGEGFQPLQAQFLKKAMGAEEAMGKRAEFLMRQAQAYQNIAETAATKREALAAQAAQNQVLNEIRLMNAHTARMNSGDGSLGAGAATQIGSGPNNEPIFRQKNGQLFTYDQGGQPIAYAGSVLPRANSSQPTEDERKAAGWFFQADNARRNMAGVISKNPGAAYPTVPERLAGFVPGVGGDIQNALRPEDRQKFVQAASSMSEALLRAATGAGINAFEADQKVKELVPQLGDKSGTVKQKMDAYEVYMKSLQSRAGRALPQNAPGAGAEAEPGGGLNLAEKNELNRLRQKYGSKAGD